MEDTKPSYYAIIPANVRYSKVLKANEKLLYGEITALANAKGYCYANNSYFAKLYDVSTTSISKWISNLAKNGFIKSVITYKENTKQIDNRYITIVQYPIEEKLKTPIEEKLKDNTTSSNTTSINKKNNIKKEDGKFTFKLSKSTQLENTSDEYQHQVSLYSIQKWGDRGTGLFEAMRDFHTAKGSLFKDWSAVMRTWERNDTKFNKKPNYSKKANAPQVGSMAWMEQQAKRDQENIIDVEDMR